MKSYESTLAFSYGRRVCRLSSSIFPTRISSSGTSRILAFLSIFSLFLSSVNATVQQQIINQQQTSSSILLINGTTTSSSSSSSSVVNSSHQQQQQQQQESILSADDEFFNLTDSLQIEQTDVRNPTILILVVSICSLMTLLTIVGNLVLILTVCLVRKLQTASNILIVSLAVSDIFVGLFIMPLSLIYLITRTWIIGEIMCDMWTSMDVLLCTASILNFLVISIDRYFIINHPFKYAPMRKVKLLSFMIAGVWILSTLVSFPPILGWGRPSVPLKTSGHCEVNPNLDYQIFATMLSFYIPLVVVLIIYANIYRTAQTAMDTRSSVQMSQYLTHNNSSNNITPTNHLLPQQKQKPKQQQQQQSNGNSCSSAHLYLNVSNAHQPDETSSTSTVGKRSLKRSGKTSHTSKTTSFLSPARCLGRRISTPLNGRLSIFVTRRQTFFRHVHLPNQKAIRTLGVILGTFIICWLPFMLFAIIKPLHKRISGFYGEEKKINAPDWLDPVLLWFGYSSAMLNPIIFSKFNREFRMPFREIMCCRCKGLNEKIRRQEYLENVYGDNHLQPATAPTQHLTTSTRNSGYPEVAV